MSERRHDNTKSTVVMWAPCPWSHPTGKECNVITKRIPIVLGHFVNRTVLPLTHCWVTCQIVEWYNTDNLQSDNFESVQDLWQTYKSIDPGKSYCYCSNIVLKYISGLILGLHPVNERHRYKVTLSLIGWAQT